MPVPDAVIGVFGGSGFYSLIENPTKVAVETPYGRPSALPAVGELAGKRVAFLPRHGEQHQFPPHAVNYRANLWAMKELGVTRIIAPCAAGSLQARIHVGDFVICDQLVDRTSGRKATFYDGPVTTHVSFADPYCPRMREAAAKACKAAGVLYHERGTVVVIEGPRFSTSAESRSFTSMGWEAINMTQYPEAVLARELEICYATIAAITDYDAGLVGEAGVAPVTHDEVIRVFRDNIGKLKRVIAEMIALLPADRPPDGCGCGSALTGARMG